MDRAFYSILIVTYNGRHHLGPCLEALAKQAFPRHRYEIVVVDNASIDGTAAYLGEEFPHVRVVRLAQNAGFAGGNNAGLGFCRGRYVVLLNNDTMPDPHWLAELAVVVERGHETRVASKLVFAADPTRLNSAGLELLRDGRAIDRGFRQPDQGQFEAEAPVFAACGAAVVVDRTRHPGPLFDSRYFVYYEDLDAAWREQLAGHTVSYAPRSLVRHVHGGTSGTESPLFRFHVERNRALTNLRNADLFLAVWTAVGLAARVVRSGLRWATRREDRRLAFATAAALGSFLRHAPAVMVERYIARGQTKRVCP